MPYIITTTNPALRAAFDEAGGRGVDLAERIDAAESRTAVATLDEARETMSGIVGDVYIRTGATLDAEWAAFHDSALPGTVGPLPDGTVIEVRPVDRFTLGWEAGLIAADHPQLWKDADLVKRFNAS